MWQVLENNQITNVHVILLLLKCWWIAFNWYARHLFSQYGL